MKGKYCNPAVFSDGMRHTNPDPFILSWCGAYYCYASDEFGVKVSVSEDLVYWEFKGYAIREPAYRHYWAPSVLYENGKFYMYYSNVPAGETDCHQEWLKLAVSDDPVRGFIHKKTFFNKFSIDSHPVMWNGKLYMFYSVNDWNGTDAHISGTSILLDEMEDMETFSGHPREVVAPGIREEIYEENRFGDGRDWYTIEGAAHVVRGSRFWLMYSANAYVKTDYFIGTAIARCAADMDEMEWKKYPSETVWYPLLKKNEAVEGTGHNTVAKAPNLTDDWIVYHGRRACEELLLDVEQREMRIDPLYFNGDEVLCFGPGWEKTDAPLSAHIRYGEKPVDKVVFLGPAVPYYRAEIWIKAKLSHTGASWGIYVDYIDECNYVECRYHSGKSQIGLYVCTEGIRCRLSEISIQRAFDYTVPHCVRITRKKHTYEVILDDRETIFSEAYMGDMCMSGEGKVGLRSYFTQLTMMSCAMTYTAFLCGNDLKYMGDFYSLTPCVLDRGISSVRRPIEMMRKQCPHKDYKECFTFESISGMNRVEFVCGDHVVRLSDNVQHPFSIYHFHRDGKDEFLADGIWIRPADLFEEAYGYRMHGVNLTEYEYVCL